MIVSQAEINQINSGRIRRRVLHLPVRYGTEFGELKRCPVRLGGVYQLRARIPYDQHRRDAESQPTRARSVLFLIDCCERVGRTATITVLQAERQNEEWIIRFEKGERPELVDSDIYLSRHNDFTMIASRQTVRGDPPYLAPLAEDLRRAREKATESRVSPRLSATRRAIGEAGELQREMASMKTRSLAKRAERTLRALEVALLAESALDSESLAATNGSQGEDDRLPTASTSATPEAA